MKAATTKTYGKQPIPRARRALFFSLFALLNLFIVFVTLELILRSLEPAEDAELRWYRLVTEAEVPWNSFRNRDLNYLQDKPEGVFRIACVGDSFTYGQGVYFDDSFPKRLERKLNLVDPSRRYEVLNYGKRGYNTEMEVGQVFSALRFTPDVLILGFCLNDAETFADGQTKESLRAWLGNPEPATVSRRLCRFSFLCRKARDVLWSRRTTHRNQAYILSNFREAYPGWQICKASLGKMARLCQSRGAKPMVLIFPLFFGRRIDENYPFEGVHRKVADAAVKEGFEVLDLLPVFRNMRTLRLVTHPDADFHPNEMAHRITTDAIFSRLVQQGIVQLPASKEDAGASGNSNGHP